MVSIQAEKQAEAVADRIVNQCMISMEQACEELGINPDDIADELDNLVFCCDECGWYCSTEELNNETDQNLCDDCNDDED